MRSFMSVKEWQTDYSLTSSPRFDPDVLQNRPLSKRIPLQPPPNPPSCDVELVSEATHRWRWRKWRRRRCPSQTETSACSLAGSKHRSPGSGNLAAGCPETSWLGLSKRNSTADGHERWYCVWYKVRGHLIITPKAGSSQLFTIYLNAAGLHFPLQVIGYYNSKGVTKSGNIVQHHVLNKHLGVMVKCPQTFWPYHVFRNV